MTSEPFGEGALYASSGMRLMVGKLLELMAVVLKGMIGAIACIRR